jgi:hypothetical protein
MTTGFQSRLDEKRGSRQKVSTRPAAAQLKAVEDIDDALTEIKKA